MKNRLLGFLRTNRKGLALISVLGVVTLATILILALFSVSDAEFKAARNYADGTLARQLADTAVNLVISQIQAGATGAGVDGTSTTSVNRTIWASQPGAIRVYKSNGQFAQGRRLYSSKEMVLNEAGNEGEKKMARDVPDSNWSDNKAVWVDLNQPVVRTQTSGQAGTEVYFPIVDPRASTTVNGFRSIEGFSYSGQTIPGQPELAGVVQNGPAETLRVPMPVRWLYVLKDGSMGTVVDTGNNTSQWNGNAGSGRPTADNPIVGRVAFWTDDETSRVNINTAGEPGSFATPSIFHLRDDRWANFQPSWREFQRYPGHPATVALSSVLAPNPDHNPARYDTDNFMSTFPYYTKDFIALKDAICTLVPKLSPGGSADGTRAYAPDDFIGEVTPDIAELQRQYELAATKHLYPSVDEWIFANKQLSSTDRTLVNSKTDLGSLVTPSTLERAKFFLTASSRSPELNMFGLPRVAIWPVPDASLGKKFRTGYDSALAYMSSLPGARADDMGISRNNYYFSRRDSMSAIEDVGGGVPSAGLTRNNNLLTYLDFLVSGPAMPGGGTFRGKYGIKDSRQILVEIFDYIRTTNLYDAFLDDEYVNERPDKKHDLWDDNDNHFDKTQFAGATKLNKQSDLWNNRPAQFSYYTYTAPRFDTIRRVEDLGGIVPTNPDRRSEYQSKRVTTGAYPGHGQVRPIEWTVGGETYKGFGRFPTISEVSLHFICTADGHIGNNHDWPGVFQVPVPQSPEHPNGIAYSGGRTAKQIDPKKESPEFPRSAWIVGERDGHLIPGWWYSNLPPFPSVETFEDVWGMDFKQYGLGGQKDPIRHPAINAMNWNGTLDRNTPLRENQKRIQVMFQIEMFVPALGYTKYAPDFSIVLNGNTIGGFQVDALNKSGGTYSQSLFETTANQVIQSTTAYMGSALGESVNNVNVTPLGGNYGTAPLMAGRQVKAPAPLTNDPGYNSSATGDPHAAMLNFPLVSNFFTVDRNKNIKFRAPKSPIQFDIYAAHDRSGKNSTPSQRVFVQFQDGEVPPPYLVVYSTEKWRFIDNSGNNYEREAVHAPRWWAFNAGGALQRWEGRVGPNGNFGAIKDHQYNAGSDTFDVRGRFASTGHSLTQTNDTFRGASHKPPPGVSIPSPPQYPTMPSSVGIYGYAPTSTYWAVRSNPLQDTNKDVYQDEGEKIDGGKKMIGMGNCQFYGTDSVRSMVPDHGDYRILAARPKVESSTWVKHRVWTERAGDLFAHSLMGGQRSDLEAGVDLGGSDAATVNPAFRLINAWYPVTQVPDTPLTQPASALSLRTGDFDTGVGDIRDGAYINKADDGNLSVDQEWYGRLENGKGALKITRNSYFKSSFLQFPATGAYFTPNRMMPSPGMFGSLPTGVYGSGPVGLPAGQQANGVPWRTLLFRPDNPGTHYGNTKVSPADHNFLDLFWMPVVEPYAITDSFSTAGKVNLNYQIVPFRHIKRATGMHAVLKSELITAFSPKDSRPLPNGNASVPGVGNTIIYKTYKDNSTAPPKVWGEQDPMEWHRRIAIDDTLKSFEDRFDCASMPDGMQTGLFRTASQICEVNLMPARSTAREKVGEPRLTTIDTEGRRRTAMASFWAFNSMTGENLRERTYSNVYQKVTTKSNSYRVYFIAQAVKKAKSVAADTVDLKKDTVTGEYRGSALIDRFLDFTSIERGDTNATPFPDYANGATLFGVNSKPSMETMYHYRVLEMKQFSP